MLKKIGIDAMRTLLGMIHFPKSISGTAANQNEEEIDSFADEAKHKSRKKKAKFPKIKQLQV